MKRVNPNHQNLLLPAGFRKAGNVIIVCLAIGISLLRSVSSTAGLWKQPAFQVASSSLFLLALVFIVWSRDGEEDERLSLYRLNAIKVSFFACILFFLTMSVLYITAVYREPQIRGIEPVIGLMLVYQLAFKLQKNGYV